MVLVDSKIALSGLAGFLLKAGLIIIQIWIIRNDPKQLRPLLAAHLRKHKTGYLLISLPG